MLYTYLTELIIKMKVIYLKCYNGFNRTLSIYAILFIPLFLSAVKKGFLKAVGHFLGPESTSYMVLVKLQRRDTFWGPALKAIHVTVGTDNCH